MEYINEPKLCGSQIFYDKRGTFAPLSLTSHLTWIQSNISININKFTLRGIHFQAEPFSQSKLIKVINGRIIDFVVDLRKNSPNFFKVKIFYLNSGDELYVPKNFGHGFLTTENNTIVQYLVDNIYNPESEGSIVWTTFPELLEEFNQLENFSINSIVINEKDLLDKNLGEIKIT